MENINEILKKLQLAKGHVESLAKWERQQSVQMVNREAHYQALAGVKDHILKWTANAFRDMKDEEVKHIPVSDCELTVRKIMADMYSGQVRRGTQVIHQFDRITIPQIAGQLQSLLELYDPDKLEAEASPNALIVEKLKPLAEQAPSGMVSQLISILSGQPPKPHDAPAPEKDDKTLVAEVIAEANAIAEEAKNRMQRVDPRAEVQDLKERVEQMLSRVESIVSLVAPTGKRDDKFQDTLHQMQRKHDQLVDRAQQELNILNDKIKELTERLKKPRSAGGKTITIMVD
jgi:hypothetical protein